MLPNAQNFVKQIPGSEKQKEKEETKNYWQKISKKKQLFGLVTLSMMGCSKFQEERRKTTWVENWPCGDPIYFGQSHELFDHSLNLQEKTLFFKKKNDDKLFFFQKKKKR